MRLTACRTRAERSEGTAVDASATTAASGSSAC